jgi:hypothetical protein
MHGPIVNIQSVKGYDPDMSAGIAEHLDNLTTDEPGPSGYECIRVLETG